MRRTAAGFVAAVLFAAAIAGCSAPPRTSGPPGWDSTRSLILISVDGLGWDYLDRFRPENLLELAESGVRAEGLIPVFPTTTFPNHYTIVTGLYPAHHGVVSNTMYDPERDARFSLGNRAAIADSSWWGGEPIWVTAERQGLVTATQFWPGSEVPVKGIRPTYWKRYDGSVPGEQRVDQVLDWLDLPPGRRPSFISVYFSRVDAAGHDYGPTDPRTGEAVAEVDGFIGRLVDGLESLGLLGSINLMIVSDHGMAARSPDRTIFLDDYIDLEHVEVVEWSPVLALRPLTIGIDTLFHRLDGAHPRLRVYRAGGLPERLEYRDNPRIMPVIGIVDEGWSVARRNGFNADYYLGGTHGYDNALKSMQAVFIANGPAFAAGSSVPAFENVHLYELMADILGISAAPNDGSLEATDRMRPHRQKSRAVH